MNSKVPRYTTASPLIVAAGVLSVAGLPEIVSAMQAVDGESPETIELTGVVRDFHENSEADGHPDFEVTPSAGFGHYMGNVLTTLGNDGKPIFTGNGFKRNNQWKDSQDRNIAQHMYNRRWVENGGSPVLTQDESLDDSQGSQGASSTGGIASADSFNQWFRDMPGVNLSKQVSLTLVRQEDGSYVFDDQLDPQYNEIGGFFPIDQELFGNSDGSPNHNFHFTFELHTEFTYQEDGNQVFRFTGDDDVWVFIDGKLAIDLGGVHSAEDQYIDLNRMGLEDGENYELAFFFAERHRTQSNFRITTNLELETVEFPSVTDAYD